MKKLNIYYCFLLVISCLFSNSLWSQRSFEGKTKEISQQEKNELESTFTDYQIFDFDIAAFNAYIKSNDELMNFELSIGSEYNWDINLEKNELRSFDYTQTEMTDNGPVQIPRGECITYAGFLRGTSSQVRLNIQAHRVWGFVESAKGSFYIEPLNRFINNAENDTYVLYKPTDLVNHGHTCTADHNTTSHHKIIDMKDDLKSVEKSAGDDCRKLEIATEADYEFHDDGLDNSDIIGNLNLVESNYESTYNMTFFVVFQNIWTTSADPYNATGACSLGPFLPEFQNYWVANFTNIRRDINVLYSGKNLTAPVIGCAWTGSFRNNVDNDNGAYCVNEWQSTSLSNQVIIGHEMGHIFGSPHVFNTTGIMNPFLGTSLVFQDSAKILMNAGMDFTSTTINDGRSAIRIRDFPSNSNTSSTTLNADVTANRSANEWHMDREMRINSIFFDDDMEFFATERILLKPGYKAVIDDAGNSLILKIDACNDN